MSDLVQQVQHSGLVASISGSTLWRWLHEDAIRPWYHRSRIFPRDPDFATKAGRVLDLYARQWEGTELKDDEFVSPCVLASPSPPSGWTEDFHLQTAEHAQHTTKPLARRTASPCIR